MIQDLSETLRAILDDPSLSARFPELAAAQVVFDRPTEQFQPTQATVDLFLYDVRENRTLRSNEPLVERRNGAALIRRPPLRVACSYLLTAWAVGGAEPVLREQRLLSQALQVLSRYPTIPPEFLRGSLVGQEPPLPLVKAQADGLKEPSEFWTAIGNKLRPSLTLTATIALDIFPAETAPLAASREVRVGERTGPAEERLKEAGAEGYFTIGGRVTDASGAGLAGASVEVVERGLAARTDATGRYALGTLPAGDYTLRAQSGSNTRSVTVTVPAESATGYNVQLS